MSEIVKIDDRGRIVIPGTTRKMFNLLPGTKLLLVGDEKANRIVLTPFLGEDTKPVSLKIMISDEPMSLARVATALGKLHINLLLGEAHIIRHGVHAEWSIVADLATMKEELSLEEIAAILKENGALSVEWQDYL